MVISASDELVINGCIESTTTEYGNASALHIAINQDEGNTAKTTINGDGLMVNRNEVSQRDLKKF